MIEATGTLERATQLHYTVPIDPLRIFGNQSKEIIRIAQDGRIFWHGREVETDDDFRGAMMELAQHMLVTR